MAVVDVLTGWFLQLPVCVCLLDAWPDYFSSKRFACEGGFPQTALLVSGFFSLQRSWLDGCARCLSPTFAEPDALVGFCSALRRANPIFGTSNDVNHLGYPAKLRGRDRRCGKIDGTKSDLWGFVAKVGVVWLLCDGMITKRSVWRHLCIYYVSSYSRLHKILGSPLCLECWKTKTLTLGAYFKAMEMTHLDNCLMDRIFPKSSNPPEDAALKSKRLRTCSNNNNNNMNMQQQPQPQPQPVSKPITPFKFRLIRWTTPVLSTGKPLATRGLEAPKSSADPAFLGWSGSAFARAGRTTMSWLLKIGHALRNLMKWCQFCDFWFWKAAKTWNRALLRFSGAQAASTGSSAAALWIGEVRDKP